MVGGIICCVLGLFGCATAPSSSTVPERLCLFNGKNLQGWRAYLASHEVGPEQVWQVRHRILFCRGQPMGYLYTTQSFQNFRLIVEWRWPPGSKPGNSGIFLRINGEPRPLPRCVEVQLKSGNAGDLFGFHGMALDGPPERIRKIVGHKLGGNMTALVRMRTAERPPGEWNRAEIILQGDRLSVVINGQKVNEAWGVEQIRGPIGLQSEGSPIEFRRVELIPLSSH